MKRILGPALAALVALSVLGGCSKTSPAAGESSAAPAEPVTAAALTPGHSPEPTPAPEPTQETASAVAEAKELPLGEGYFPGGLDDDGRGADEYEDETVPVESIQMTPEQQYEANIFLSNFAEQSFADYTWLASDDVARMVDLVHTWCKINDQSAIGYETVDGTVYERLTLEQVSVRASRYFPYTIEAWDAETFYPASDDSFYRDGAFYFTAADGEAYNRFAVAEGMTLLSDETYVLRFAVYELDIETYFNEGLSSDYYRMTPEQAAAAPELTRVAEGEALTLPYSYRGRATFQLLEYSTW